MLNRLRPSRLRVLAFRSLTALALCLLLPCAATAAPFTYSGFTFEQNSTPNVISLIGNGANLGGAQFSAGTATRITRSVGFIADSVSPGNANAGFNPAPGWVNGRSLGQQANAQLGLTQPDGTGSLFSSAINLPNGNVGTATRHGLSVGWSGGVGLVNGAGNDFIIYESGSNATSPEGFMVRVRNAATGAFSPWYYEAMEGFETYRNSPATNEGAFAVGFDLSNLGVALGGIIDLIQIANLTGADRIAPTSSTDGGFALSGNVQFNGAGQLPSLGLLAGLNRNSTYNSGSLDPDPLYVGIVGNLAPVNAIPEPGTLALLGLGLAGVVGSRLRRRAA